MKKLNIVIDVAKCENCNNCFLACKDEFVDNDFPPYSIAQPRHGQRWVNIMHKERGQFPVIDIAYLPVPCMHCDNAPCMKKGDGSIYKTDSGAVIIDPAKAHSREEIPNSCPYGAIFWNEEKNVAQKCTFCLHLLEDGWNEPRCIQACPTGAMRLVSADDTEMARIVAGEGLEVLHPEYKTKPRVYYKNLHRFFKCFIGGSVAIKKGALTDCAEGAKVSLSKDKQKIGEVTTDNYGDFKFDNLEENSGRYNIDISLDGYEKKAIEIDLKTSENLGTILLN